VVLAAIVGSVLVLGAALVVHALRHHPPPATSAPGH
jgi:hypothetical protein